MGNVSDVLVSGSVFGNTEDYSFGEPFHFGYGGRDINGREEERTKEKETK